jgi:cytochrome c heme-lyase
LKFQGRPNDLSTKAFFKHHVLGYVKPFDRHDWTVDRCGKYVEYILDFYEGSQSSTDTQSTPSSASASLPPPSSSVSGLPSMYIDVRPKATVQGVYDRTRIMINRYFQI